MSKVNEITISGANLFTGWQAAGIDGNSNHSARMEWESKSQTDKVLAVLEFIRARANAIRSHQSDDIADIKSIAQRVLAECDRIEGGDLLGLIRLGARMETIRTLLAANQAIEFNVKMTEVQAELIEATRTLQKLTDREEKRTSPINSINERRRLADAEIQEEAKQIFAADSEKELKTGYVAELLLSSGTVHGIQKKHGLEEIKVAAVKEKIKIIAPDYAKKGGRPKK